MRGNHQTNSSGHTIKIQFVKLKIYIKKTKFRLFTKKQIESLLMPDQEYEDGCSLSFDDVIVFFRGGSFCEFICHTCYVVCYKSV